MGVNPTQAQAHELLFVWCSPAAQHPLVIKCTSSTCHKRTQVRTLNNNLNNNCEHGQRVSWRVYLTRLGWTQQVFRVPPHMHKMLPQACRVSAHLQVDPDLVCAPSLGPAFYHRCLPFWISPQKAELRASVARPLPACLAAIPAQGA